MTFGGVVYFGVLLVFSTVRGLRMRILRAVFEDQGVARSNRFLGAWVWIGRLVGRSFRS